MRLKNGKIKAGDKIKLMSTDAVYDVTEVGVYTPAVKKKNELVCGEVGYLWGSIKSISDVRVGDTVTVIGRESEEMLPGYKPMKQVVFAGLYPTETSRYNELREALSKLKLNDASLSYERLTAFSLIVIPLSLSKSIESNICSFNSLFSIELVFSSILSANVLFP
jgi:GTP-binding protein LepA